MNTTFPCNEREPVVFIIYFLYRNIHCNENYSSIILPLARLPSIPSREPILIPFNHKITGSMFPHNLKKKEFFQIISSIDSKNNRIKY